MWQRSWFVSIDRFSCVFFLDVIIIFFFFFFFFSFLQFLVSSPFNPLNDVFGVCVVYTINILALQLDHFRKCMSHRYLLMMLKRSAQSFQFSHRSLFTEAFSIYLLLAHTHRQVNNGNQMITYYPLIDRFFSFFTSVWAVYQLKLFSFGRIIKRWERDREKSEINKNQ